MEENFAKEEKDSNHYGVKLSSLQADKCRLLREIISLFKKWAGEGRKSLYFLAAPETFFNEMRTAINWGTIYEWSSTGTMYKLVVQKDHREYVDERFINAGKEWVVFFYAETLAKSPRRKEDEKEQASYENHKKRALTFTTVIDGYLRSHPLGIALSSFDFRLGLDKGKNKWV